MQLTGENQPNKLREQALVIFESLYGTTEQHSDNDDNGGGGDGKSKNSNKKSNTKTFIRLATTGFKMFWNDTVNLKLLGLMIHIQKHQMMLQKSQRTQ
jgi:hypothetical protein